MAENVSANPLTRELQCDSLRARAQSTPANAGAEGDIQRVKNCCVAENESPN